MNFILMPSLEHRVLVKIVIILWSRDDLRDGILKSFKTKDEWQGMENCVAKKVADLPIPEKFKEKLFTNIESVGIRIRVWLWEQCVFIDPHVIQKLQTMAIWTSHGTIDKKRTAEVFVVDETLGLHHRFEMASYCCLEDHIRDIWRKCNSNDFERTIRLESNVLTEFWFDYLKDNVEVPSVRTFENDFQRYKSLFQSSAFSGNVVATKYFCFKLSPESTEEVRMQTAMRLAEDRNVATESIADVLFFLLSTMNADQQAEILKRKSYVVLNSSLSWPWRSLFLEIAKKCVSFLSKTEYGYLSHNIVGRLVKHNNIKELFGDFYQQTRESWLQFITEKGNLGSILLKLYHKNERTVIKFILEDLYNSARKIGDQDHFSGALVTRCDSNGVTFRRHDKNTEFKWSEILQLIEYCKYHLQ